MLISFIKSCGGLTMKTKRTAFAFLSILIGLGVSALSHAEVELTVAKTLNLDETPVDTAMSAGGRSIFVLTDKGKVLVFSSDGKLTDTIAVDKSVDSIKAGPREQILVLVSRKKKTVHVALI
jgi:hypothetical protein